MRTLTIKTLKPALQSRDALAFALAAGLVLAVKSGLVAQVPW